MGRINDYIILYAVQGQTLGGFRAISDMVCHTLSYLWTQQAENNDDISHRDIENHKGAYRRINHHSHEAYGAKNDEYFLGECYAFIEQTSKELQGIDTRLLKSLCEETLRCGTLGVINFMRNELDISTRNMIELSFNLPNIHRTELWEYYKLSRKQ